MLRFRLKPWAICKWLAEPRLFWVAFLVIVATSYAACRGGEEWHFRYAGLALQLCGILTTAWGFLETRLFFGQPGITDYVGKWWARFPLRRKDATVNLLGAASASVTSNFSGYLSSTASPDSPIVVRIRALEANLDTLQKLVVAEQSKNSQHFRKLEAKLDEEKHLRTDEI